MNWWTTLAVVAVVSTLSTGRGPHTGLYLAVSHQQAPADYAAAICQELIQNRCGNPDPAFFAHHTIVRFPDHRFACPLSCHLDSIEDSVHHDSATSGRKLLSTTDEVKAQAQNVAKKAGEVLGKVTSGLTAALGVGAALLSAGLSTASIVGGTVASALSVVQLGILKEAGQFIAITAYLSVSYPPVYREFTSGFGWMNGAINIGAIKNADFTGSFNYRNISFDIIDVDDLDNVPWVVEHSDQSGSSKHFNSLAALDILKKLNSTNTNGIVEFCRSQNINPNKLFDTVVFMVGLFLGIASAILLPMAIFRKLFARCIKKCFKNSEAHPFRYYLNVVVQIISAGYFGLFISSLNQLLWLSSFESWIDVREALYPILVLLTLTVGIFGYGFYGMHVRNRDIEDKRLEVQFQKYFEDYKDTKWGFFVAKYSEKIITSSVIVILVYQPLYQVLGIMIANVGIAVLIMIFQPFYDKTAQRLETVFAWTRAMICCMLFAFLNPDQKQYKNIIAYILIAFQVLMMLTLVCLILRVVIWHANEKQKLTSPKRSRVSGASFGNTAEFEATGKKSRRRTQKSMDALESTGPRRKTVDSPLSRKDTMDDGPKSRRSLGKSSRRGTAGGPAAADEV